MATPQALPRLLHLNLAYMPESILGEMRHSFCTGGACPLPGRQLQARIFQDGERRGCPKNLDVNLSVTSYVPAVRPRTPIAACLRRTQLLIPRSASSTPPETPSPAQRCNSYIRPDPQTGSARLLSSAQIFRPSRSKPHAHPKTRRTSSPSKPRTHARNPSQSLDNSPRPP